MQDLVAILVAGSAAAFLLRRGWKSIAARRRGQCGACSQCRVPDGTIAPNLVAISPLVARDKPQKLAG